MADTWQVIDLTDPVTPGEVGRRLADLRTDVHRIRDRLENLPDTGDLQNLAAAWVAQLTALERRVDDQGLRLDRRIDDEVADMGRRVAQTEAWQTWALRLVVGALLTAAVAALLTGTVLP